MKKDSLQLRGGDGRTFTMEDRPELRAGVIQILEGMPASDVAKIAVDESHTLFPALQYLIHNSHITTAQYDILATEIAKNRVRKSDTLVLITNRMSLNQRQIADLLGWNKYPTEDDPSVDIEC